MKLIINNIETELNNTYQNDHYYKSLMDLPDSVYESLMGSTPYVRNDSYTLYEDVTFLDLKIKDDKGDMFNCYVSIDGDHVNNDCLFEWISDLDLRLENID